jgi:predicted transcriptional regulator
MQDNEKKLDALDESLDRGIADMEAGRTYKAEDVFFELRERYTINSSTNSLQSTHVSDFHIQ